MMQKMMMKFLSNILSFIAKKFCLLALFLLAACNSFPTKEERNLKADSFAESKNFVKQLVEADDFVITTYQKITDKNAPFIFYIEGDGFAFINRYTISDDPTPMNQMLFRLASMDERANIVYMARPCQYTPNELNPKCGKSIYWTDKRMGQEVISAIKKAVDKIRAGQKYSMIGYSGGGGVAVLIASIDAKDILWIMTIAGNLNLEKFARYHKAFPMTLSLDPIEYVGKINNIPQLHIAGEKDDIVPPMISQSYIKSSDSLCVKGKVIPDVTHNKGWEEIWREIISWPLPDCK